jgi:hypothetical protein
VRSPDDGVSILRLPVDVSDPVQRRRVEQMFSAAFSVRRAVQRGARNRARAYRAACHERAIDASAVRTRLGLSRDALEDEAFRCLNEAPHLRHFVTKALAQHLADSVWSAFERHLFKDAAGARHGLPRPSRWHDFTRLPGRARSHTKANKWETFRLHGSLAGHRAAYSPDGSFMQPRRMRPVTLPRGATWWDYDGPLAVVFSGLPDGTLVLPVRLPAASSNQAILDHHLADPSRWHKIDLVRRRDPNQPGGWRYEAHLMVLTTPYVAPAVQARRQASAIETITRAAGIDLNVSNVTVASHDRGRDLQVTRIAKDPAVKQADRRRERRRARRQRKLERSRRAANPSQYQLSKRQEKRARRRAEAGLAAQQVIPAGPRIARTDRKPLQAFRKDQLSRTYRRERAADVADAAAAAQAGRDRARQVAGTIVREHGFQLTVEDCNLAAWARSWGRSLAAFAPGTLLAAIEREAAAVGRLAGVVGVLERAATRTTALSQHCLCGARVPKSLGQRTHACVACGLRGDRDAIAATLAACVVLAEPARATTATIDRAMATTLLAAPHTRDVLARTLPYSVLGRQDVPSESNAHSARDGSFVAGRGGHPTSSWWLGESLARPRAQPRMRLAGSVRPRRSGHDGEPTWSYASAVAQLRNSS